jgi:hypothetical protein
LEQVSHGFASHGFASILHGACLGHGVEHVAQGTTLGAEHAGLAGQGAGAQVVHGVAFAGASHLGHGVGAAQVVHAVGRWNSLAISQPLHGAGLAQVAHDGALLQSPFGQGTETIVSLHPQPVDASAHPLQPATDEPWTSLMLGSCSKTGIGSPSETAGTTFCAKRDVAAKRLAAVDTR